MEKKNKQGNVTERARFYFSGDRENRKGKINTCIKRMKKEKMIIKICCKYYGREEGQQRYKIIKRINFVIGQMGLRF